MYNIVVFRAIGNGDYLYVVSVHINIIKFESR